MNTTIQVASTRIPQDPTGLAAKASAIHNRPFELQCLRLDGRAIENTYAVDNRSALRAGNRGAARFSFAILGQGVVAIGCGANSMGDRAWLADAVGEEPAQRLG